MKEHGHEKSVRVWRNLGVILCMMNAKKYINLHLEKMKRNVIFIVIHQKYLQG